MRVLVTAEVQYCCELNKEDSQKVIKYAKENNLDYERAVGELYPDINLYENSYETDFSTENIDEVELDDEEDEEEDEEEGE